MAATRRIVTPIFRAAFLNVLEPKETENGAWVYEVSMIFEPSADISELKAIFSEAVQDKWKGSPPKTGVISPFRRGEWKSEAYPQGFNLDKYPYYEGNIIVTARAYTNKLATGNFDSSKKPGLTGPDPTAIFDPHNNPAHSVYSGMYARAEVSMYVPKLGGDRVAVGLHNLQKCYDGDPLGFGNAPAEKVFGTFVAPEGQGNHSDLMDLSGV